MQITQGERRENKTVIFPQASRAQILNKATEYIQDMTRKNTCHKDDIEELRQQNTELEMKSKDSCCEYRVFFLWCSVFDRVSCPRFSSDFRTP